jgi:hypothetical protein
MSALVHPRRLLTLKETAAALHYSERQVRRLIDEHGLPVLRLAGPGSAPRIPARPERKKAMSTIFKPSSPTIGSPHPPGGPIAKPPQK